MTDLLGRQDAFFLGLYGKLSFQCSLFALALINTSHNHICALPLFKSLPQVFNGYVSVTDCCLNTLYGGTVVLSSADCINGFCDSLDVVTGQELTASLNNLVLDNFLVDNLLFAQALLSLFAGIVVIYLARLAGSAIASHHFTAVAAEQLGGQQIIFFASTPRRGGFVFIQNTLYPLKSLVAEYARHTTRSLFAFIEIYACVALISQKAVKTVFIKIVADGRLDLSGIQISDDICDRFTFAIALEDFADNDGFIFIHIERPILRHFIAKTRVASIGQTLLGIDLHATMDLLGQFGGVVFCHTLQHTFHQNARSVISDVFFGRDNTDIVLLELGLVDGAVITVSRKAVKLINENGIKGVMIAVGNHTLKLGTIV